MWRYHLTSTPLRAGLFLGLAFGAIMGTPVGVAERSVVVGVIGAAIGGTIFGIITGLAARGPLQSLAGLSSVERATIMHAVTRGLAVGDRRLAPAVVGYAQAVRSRQGWISTKWGSNLFWAVAVIQAVRAVTAAMDGDWAAVALRLLLGVAVLLSLRWRDRRLARLEQAERSAQALL